MDEIDSIIVNSLREIGCDLEENCTLSDLEPSSIVRCVSKCLRCIDPTIEVPLSMPSGMAQKYGVTLALAEACTKIGYRGDIGYQTFLYSSTNRADLRRILMFLIDALPKDESDGVVQVATLSPREKLEQQMRQSLALSLQTHRKMNTITNAIQPSQLEFQAAAGNYNRQKSIFAQTSPGNIWATILSNNSIETQDNIHWRRSRSKPMIGVKPSASMNSVNSSKSIEESHSAIEEDEIQEKIDPFEERRLLIDSLKQQIVQRQQEREEILVQIKEIQRKSDAGEENLNQLKLQKKIKERTLLVLENPEENVQRLQRMIENSGEKMKRLEEQWTEHKTPLMAAIGKINSRKEAQESKTQAIVEHIREARKKQDRLRAEMVDKTELYAQVMTDLGKVNQKTDRSAYTNRILEIIGNIRKQKADIDKILGDTRQVQKDINSVTGKLDRQFAVTDDLLFGNAKRDETSRRAYKLLVAMHGDCAQLVKSVQDTGKIGRDIRDLEEQIENARAANTAANLQQISNDLEQMQSENQKLAEQILRLRSELKNHH